MAQDVAKLENQAPTTSSTLDSRLLPLIQTRTEVVDGACVDVWRPVPVPDEAKHAAIRAVADLERELSPANREWIAARIMTLLSHYYAPEMPETLQRAVAQDWVHLLAGYPRWAIERACMDYLARDTNKRPSPGQIAGLAELAIGTKGTTLKRLRACLDCRGAPPVKRGGTVSMSDALKSLEAAKKALRASIAEDERVMREQAQARLKGR